MLDMSRYERLQQVSRTQIHVSLTHLEPEAVGPTSRQLLALSYLMYTHAEGVAFAKVTARDFNEGPWRDLVAMELASHKFIVWDRPQHSVRVNPKGEEIVIGNLTRACHAAASNDLLPLAAFLIQRMSEEELPLYLSHESRSLREAAKERLNELAQG